MKSIAIVAVMFMVLPLSFASAAEVTTPQTLTQKLNALQEQVSHLRMQVMAQVLGVSTSQLFTVTSNSLTVAQSYVPVTPALAKSWCADMSAMNSFKNTSIECIHEGNTIFRK